MQFQFLKFYNVKLLVNVFIKLSHVQVVGFIESETTHASALRLPRPFLRPTPHNLCQVHIIILFILFIFSGFPRCYPSMV
jgi:hypothetical protein